eukprot:Opistho-2@96865
MRVFIVGVACCVFMTIMIVLLCLYGVWFSVSPSFCANSSGITGMEIPSLSLSLLFLLLHISLSLALSVFSVRHCLTHTHTYTLTPLLSMNVSDGIVLFHYGGIHFPPLCGGCCVSSVSVCVARMSHAHAYYPRKYSRNDHADLVTYWVYLFSLSLSLFVETMGTAPMTLT